MPLKLGEDRFGSSLRASSVAYAVCGVKKLSVL